MAKFNCRKCGKEGETWNDWELCDGCGYRFNLATNRSPDDPPDDTIPNDDNTEVSGMSEMFFSQFYQHAVLIAKKKFCIWTGYDKEGHSKVTCYHCSWDPAKSVEENIEARKRYSGRCEVSFYGPNI